MLQKYLVIGDSPELRSDPLQRDKLTMEIELRMPIDVFDELQILVKDIRYQLDEGKSTDKLWNMFYKKILPYVALEKDRIWVIKNITR